MMFEMVPMNDGDSDEFLDAQVPLYTVGETISGWRVAGENIGLLLARLPKPCNNQTESERPRPYTVSVDYYFSKNPVRCNTEFRAKGGNLVTPIPYTIQYATKRGRSKYPPFDSQTGVLIHSILQASAFHWSGGFEWIPLGSTLAAYGERII